MNPIDNLSKEQRELLIKIVKHDKAGKSAQPGLLPVQLGDNKYHPFGLGTLDSRRDLDELARAGFLVVLKDERLKLTYQLTNEAYTAVEELESRKKESKKKSKPRNNFPTTELGDLITQRQINDLVKAIPNFNAMLDPAMAFYLRSIAENTALLRTIEDSVINAAPSVPSTAISRFAETAFSMTPIFRQIEDLAAMLASSNIFKISEMAAKMVNESFLASLDSSLRQIDLSLSNFASVVDFVQIVPEISIEANLRLYSHYAVTPSKTADTVDNEPQRDKVVIEPFPPEPSQTTVIEGGECIEIVIRRGQISKGQFLPQDGMRGHQFRFFAYTEAGVYLMNDFEQQIVEGLSQLGWNFDHIDGNAPKWFKQNLLTAKNGHYHQPMNLQSKPSGRKTDTDYDEAFKKLKQGEDELLVFKWVCEQRGWRNAGRDERASFKAAMRRRRNGT